MTVERKIKLITRWSLVTAGLIALFWAIWYLVIGNVPVVTSIKMTPDWVIQLPCGISRWWDILIGPIWSTIIILIITSEKIRKDEDLVVSLVVGLAAGLVFGLGVGLVVDLAVGLVAGLVFGLGVGLVVGLGAGLGVGLGVGLVVGLGADLAVGLAAGLGALIKWIFSKNFWETIGNWLLASDIKIKKV
jgi:hypothetical protein